MPDPVASGVSASPANASVASVSTDEADDRPPPVPAIREWDPEDRPREKLLRLGPHLLSDAELVAILLGTGTRTRHGSRSAVALARSLIERMGGSLTALSGRERAEWTELTGVGPAKAARLSAAFEVGRRIEAASPEVPDRMDAPADVARRYGPHLRRLRREVFKVVLLSTANRIIEDYTVSVGGLASSVVEPRAVFRQAILRNAASIICLHNHPSGNPRPSREDVRITRQLVRAGRIMGVPVQDHVIIAGREYTSLSERGVI